MNFIKNLFKDDEKLIGLCGFKEAAGENLNVYIPKFEPSKPLYTVNYEKNFFLL